MIVAALLAWGLTRQEPTITFESTGITVTAFCAELERQTGRRFRAWGEVRNDLLALRLVKAPIAMVLDKVMHAERARISFDGATYNIHPDLVARAKSREDRFNEKVRAAKEVLAASRPRLHSHPYDAASARRDIGVVVQEVSAQEPPDQAFYERELKRQFDSPLAQAVLKLFCSIPAYQLASAGPEVPEVWSTSPMPTEHAIPLDSAFLVQSLTSENGVWNDALSRLGDPLPEYSIRFVKQDSNNLTTLRLAVRSPGGGFWEAALSGYDATGKLLFATAENFAEPHIPASPSRQSKGLPVVQVPTDEVGALDLWCNSWNFPEKRLTELHTPAFARLFFDPEHFDPVALTLGRSLVELSRALGDQLVAAEDVRMAEGLQLDMEGPNRLNLDGLFSFLEDRDPTYDHALDYHRSDGWLELRPDDLDASAECEVARDKLGRYLRSVRDTGTRSFGVVAAFAAASGHFFGRFGYRWAAAGRDLLFPASSPLWGFQSSDDEALCRFVGLTSDDQVYEAEHAGLALSSCSDAQLDELYRSILVHGLMFDGKVGNDLRNNASVSIPRGLPGGGVLHVSTTVEHGLRVRYRESAESNAERVSQLDMSQVGMRLRKVDGHSDWRGWVMLGIRPIRDTIYRFEFAFPGGVSAVSSLSVGSYDSEEVKTFEELPDSYRREAWKSVAAENFHN